MKAILSATAMILLAATLTTAAEWTFEDAEIGKLPKGWTAAKSGDGPGSVWQINEDKTAPAGPKVLTQTSAETPKANFNICVADDSKFEDVNLTVQLKPLSGKTDQGGGPVWRYQDKDNYYVARVNPLELNFRLYKVVGGKRTQLADGVVDVDDELALLKKWHTIRIVHRGDSIECTLNGELTIKAKDDAIKTAGKVGVWTKADAVTSFDKLSVDR